MVGSEGAYLARQRDTLGVRDSEPQLVLDLFQGCLAMLKFVSYLGSSGLNLSQHEEIHYG
jgi:hypothetical protein